jgi:type VII secretion integral membrane protein EccD
MAADPGVLRVSVVGGHDRVDLVVPAAVRVAELLPELSRRVRSDDPLAEPAEVWLSVLGGARLDSGSGLAAQGVADGDVLTVTWAADHVAPVDDDLAVVVAEVVETVPHPGPAPVRWAALAVSAVLLGLGAAGAVVVGTPQAAAAAAVTSLLLVAVLVLLARRDGSAPVVATAAWLAVAHAGAAGLAAGVVAAGAAWVVGGAVAALASRRQCGPQLWAAPVVGAALATADLTARLTSAPLPVALTCALVLVVVTGELQPWLAATLAGLVPPPLGEQPPTAPDREAVARGVRRAHEVLLVSAVATGLVLVVLGPVAASRGPGGVAVAVLCCAVASLRARRQRAGLGGTVAVVGGLAPLAPVAVVVWCQWPDGRVAVVATVAGVGLLALAAVLLPSPRTARAGRLAELAEGLALVALPPALLAATGLLDVVREVVG